MKIEIINTGSELMLGRILNTHQQWLCRRLADLGYVVTRQVAVADSAQEIQQAVREALGRADLIITTGGLGPTSDDITRELVAKLLGKQLYHDPQVLAHIENFFNRRGRVRPPGTHVETLVPEGALVFQNPSGTAPGLAMETRRKHQWLVMLPGPPRELHPIFEEYVVPFLRKEFIAEPFACRTMRSTGIGESRVQELVEPALQQLIQRGVGVGYCARPGAVEVRLTASGTGAAELVQEGMTVVRDVLGHGIFGVDDDELEVMVVRGLASRKQTLALAESCTGGAIASRVTDVPGASMVFLGGVVSYANSAKESLLGVSPDSLLAQGAVSEKVAAEMALGVRARFDADFGMAVTGIAGPGGGTSEKPVGTVYIALATDAGVEVRKFFNVWDRQTFKQVTTTQALAWLCQVVSA